MKKGYWKMFSITAIIAVITAMFSGCTLEEPQMVVMAKQAGTIAAVSWIGIDNPEDTVKENVKIIVKLIKEKSGEVGSGQSYSISLQPLVDINVDELVPEQYRAITKLGGSAMLSGIDLLFAMYPEIKTKEELVVKVINSFCDGAVTGLSLSSDSPLLKAVQPNVLTRQANKGI